MVYKYQVQAHVPCHCPCMSMTMSNVHAIDGRAMDGRAMDDGSGESWREIDAFGGRLKKWREISTHTSASASSTSASASNPSQIQIQIQIQNTSKTMTMRALPPQLQTGLQLLLTLATAFVTLRLGAGLAAWRAANNLEKPKYTVVKRLPLAATATASGLRVVEVRKYEPYLIAETTVNESSMRKAGSSGFGKCAGYIFGKNESRRSKKTQLVEMSGEKMAMTAPVRSVGNTSSSSSSSEKMAMTSPVRSSGSITPNATGKTKISFVIGSKYSLQTAPKPIDKSVKVKKVDGHYLAATSFSGPPPSDNKIRQERDAILSTLEREGIRVKNKEETMVYGYHDPIVTPNCLRKNEVAVMVDGSSVSL